MNQQSKVAESTPSSRGPADPSLGGISLIFPVYNESFIIEQTLRNYIAELEPRVSDLEIIVAEDGSVDDTKAVLERLAQVIANKSVYKRSAQGLSAGGNRCPQTCYQALDLSC